MLRKDVRNAVEQGVFHLWAIKTIDEVVLLLSGRPFGQRQSDGIYPEGSSNEAVVIRLEALSRAIDGTSRERRKKKDRDLGSKTGQKS